MGQQASCLWSSGAKEREKRSIEDFRNISTIAAGSYGVVCKAKDPKSGKTVAVKMAGLMWHSSLQAEMECLLSLDHPYIIKLQEVISCPGPQAVGLVMEYVVPGDMQRYMATMQRRFTECEVKNFMHMLLDGVAHIHAKGIVHHDLKPANLLVTHDGVIKITDFGLSRKCESPSSRLPFNRMIIGTLPYTAPEIVLTQDYTVAIDMWSAGCIMAELLAKKQLFAKQKPADHLNRMFLILGSPDKSIWPRSDKRIALLGHKLLKNRRSRLREMFPRESFMEGPTLSEDGFDLLRRLLEYDPKKRISAEVALRHQWFHDIHRY